MSLKPLTINAGQIEQLASGQALDIGGWNLPTSGGTENNVLIADASGHAVWSSVLAGITSLTVDDITIDGYTISSSGVGDVIALGNRISVDGMIDGDHLVLGDRGIRFLQGSGNTLVPYSSLDIYRNTTSSVTGTLAIDLPRGAVDGQFIVKIWGHNLDGSTSSVWEALIGAYAYSSAGEGEWTSGHASVLGKPPFSSIRLGVNNTSSRLCIMLGTTTTEWKYIKLEISRLVVENGSPDWVENDWETDIYASETNFSDIITCSWHQDFIGPTASGSILVSTGDKTAAWVTELTSLTVDDITIDGAVISSDTGEISFDDDDITTTGDISADSLESVNATMYTGGTATGYAGLLSSDSEGTASVTGTCVIDLPGGFQNTMLSLRIFGYNYTISSGVWSVIVGGYTYTTAGTWYNKHASIEGNPPFTSIRLGWNGNTSRACIMLGTTTTSWTYPAIYLESMIASHGNDESYQSGWGINFYTDESNFESQSGYGDPLSVTTYQNFPSPTSGDTGKVLTATGEGTAAWV